jgi:hypothetical protein
MEETRDSQAAKPRPFLRPFLQPGGRGKDIVLFGNAVDARGPTRETNGAAEWLVMRQSRNARYLMPPPRPSLSFPATESVAHGVGFLRQGRRILKGVVLPFCEDTPAVPKNEREQLNYKGLIQRAQAWDGYIGRSDLGRYRSQYFSFSL